MYLFSQTFAIEDINHFFFFYPSVLIYFLFSSYHFPIILIILRKQKVVDERKGKFFFFIIDKKRRKCLGRISFSFYFFLELYDFLIKNNKGWWLNYWYEEKLSWLRKCSLPSKNLRMRVWVAAFQTFIY